MKRMSLTRALLLREPFFLPYSQCPAASSANTTRVFLFTSKNATAIAKTVVAHPDRLLLLQPKHSRLLGVRSLLTLLIVFHREVSLVGSRRRLVVARARVRIRQVIPGVRRRQLRRAGRVPHRSRRLRLLLAAPLPGRSGRALCYRACFLRTRARSACRRRLLSGGSRASGRGLGSCSRRRSRPGGGGSSGRRCLRLGSRLLQVPWASRGGL